MRKYAKLFLVLVLALLLACTLVACGGSVTTPDSVGGSNNDDSKIVGTPKFLSFEFDEGSSVFKHQYLDEFSVSSVKFRVNYEYVKNGITYTTKGQPITLSEEYVDASCIELLSKVGNHMIKVIYKVNGIAVSGSFALHLQDRYVEDNVTLSFDFAGGKPGFTTGTVDDASQLLTVKIPRGKTFTWADFVIKFPAFKSDAEMSYALEKWTYDGKSFNPDSQPITISKDTTFTAVWTESIIKVNFDLRLSTIPNPTYIGDAAPDTPETQTLPRKKGIVSRPSVTAINIVNGYEFAGWFTDANYTNAWNFNRLVDTSDFTLYAKWTVRTYSLTFYIMGGEFKSDITNATPGANKASANTEFTLSTQLPFKVTFSGLVYLSKYNSYTANTAVYISNGDEGSELVYKNIKLVDLQNALTKGGGNYVIEGWYTSLDFEDEDALYTFDSNTVIDKDLSLFAKWSMNVTDDESLNDYYVNYLFKNSLTVKADGTLRIDYITDAAVNEIVIPNTITYEGQKRAVTEIASRACQNSQTLISLDMSNATNLKTIADNAFAYCPMLKYVTFPTTNNITYIGEQAFLGSAWNNYYYTNQLANQNEEGFNKDELGLMIINNILYRYVGDDTVYDDMGAVVSKNTTAEITIPDTLGIETIAPYAFKDMKSLERVTVPAGVKTIHNDIFKACTVLVSFDVVDTKETPSKLEYIGDNAFRDTLYIKGDSSSPNYPSLILGPVYYRFIGANDVVSVTIPKTVKVIAPKAFVGSSALRYIYFGDEVNSGAQNIVKIGASAFSDTDWVVRPEGTASDKVYKSADGFVIINDILVNYVGTAKSVKIPENVKYIVQNTFKGFKSGNVTHITIPSMEHSLTIEGNAFSGALRLESVTLESSEAVSANPGKQILVFENTFNGDTGKIVNNNLVVYLESVSYKNIQSTTNYGVWTALYEAGKIAFDQSKINKVVINPDIFGTRYLKTSAEWKVYKEWLNEGKAEYKEDPAGSTYTLYNGAVVTYNNGAIVINDLVMPKDTVEGMDSEVSIGEKSLTFLYQSFYSINYKYFVFAAIKGAPADPNETSINGNNPDACFEISGLSTTYFTSDTVLDLSNAEIKFRYFSDSDTAEKYSVKITADMVSDYSYSLGVHTLTINYNYEGFYNYRINWTYRTVNPTNASIAQVNSLSLPLNSNPQNYIGYGELNLTLKDGSMKTVLLRSPQVFVLSVDGVPTTVFPTNEIGYHKARLVYRDGTNGTVECDYIYSVVMEADQNLFEYQFDDKNNAATIISSTGRYSSGMAIIPQSVVRIEEGIQKIYTVTKIGDNVFAGDKNLTEIKIPHTVKSIGDKAFYGCTNLAAINGFEFKKSTDVSEIEDTTVNFKRLSEQHIYSSTVEITALNGADKLKNLVVPSTFTVKTTETKQDGTGGSYYTAYKTYNCGVELSPTLFQGFRGKIWLERNAYNENYAAQYLTDKEEGVGYDFYNPGDRSLTADTYFVLGDPSLNVTSTYIHTSISLNAKATVPLLGDQTVVIPGIYSKVVDDTANSVSITEIVSYDAALFDNLKCSRLYLPNNLIDIKPLKNKDYEIVIYNIDSEYILTPVSKFPSGIQNIGNSAFENCTSLAAVDFTAATALESLGVNAFAGSALGKSDASYVLDLSKTALTDIEVGAFKNCVNVKTVVMSNLVTEIHNTAFMQCFMLDSVKFVDNNGTNVGYDHLNYIGEYSFMSCKQLVPFAEDIAQASAFDDCKII